MKEQEQSGLHAIIKKNVFFLTGCISQTDRNIKIGRLWGRVTAKTGVFQGGERALTLAADASALWDGCKHVPSKQSSAQKPLSFETGFSSSWGRRPVVSQKPLMNPFCSKIASQHNGGLIFCNEAVGGIQAVNIHGTQTSTKPNSISYGETEDDTEIKAHARWKVCPRTVWRNYPRRKRGLQLILCRYNDKGNMTNGI